MFKTNNFICFDFTMIVCTKKNTRAESFLIETNLAGQGLYDFIFANTTEFAGMADRESFNVFHNLVGHCVLTFTI